MPRLLCYMSFICDCYRISVDSSWLKSYQLRFFRRLKWQRHVKSSHTKSYTKLATSESIYFFFSFAFGAKINCEISFVAITLKGRHCVSCHCLRHIFISFCLHRIKFVYFNQEKKKKHKQIFDGFNADENGRRF